MTMTMLTRYRMIESPIGPLTLVGDDVITGLRMDRQRHAPSLPEACECDDRAFADAAEQLDAYFRRDLTEFNVAMRFEGTTFQRRVWTALLDIPYGKTESYGQLAARIGSPGAARAVGLANGRNPIAIVVPCHRVVGATGTLTGYGGGLDRKRTLLELESATLFS